MKSLSRGTLLLLLFLWSGAAAAERIDINTASLEELQELKGVGPVIAQRIIDARPFYSVDELIKVSGIGEKRLGDIKTQGLAWVDPNLQPVSQPEPKSEPEQPIAAATTTQTSPAAAKPAPEAERLTEATEKGVAAVAEPVRREYSSQPAKKSTPVFLIAFALAIFFGAIILFLKSKLKILV